MLAVDGRAKIRADWSAATTLRVAARRHNAMKIAFFVSGFPTLSETFVATQIVGLIERGHDVVIYATSLGPQSELHSEFRKYGLLERTRLRRTVLHGPLLRKLIARLGILLTNIWRYPTVVLRALNVFKYGKQAATLYILDMAMRFIERPCYDVVHCHFGANAEDAAILMELGLLRGRLVATFHGYDIREGIARSGNIYARVIRYCDAVYSISDYNLKWLEQFGFDQSRISYHPVGINVASFQGRRRGRKPGDDAVVIVTVARMVEEKGLSYALDAMAEVRCRRPDITLKYRIIGGGPLAESLKAQATQLGVEGVVEFMGPQDQSVVRLALSEADVFLLPSIAEALPVAVMEAMATGLPVVATDVGSVSELVRDGQTGKLVRPADSAALADALVGLLDDRESWLRLGAAGRLLIEQRYDLNALNDRLVQHYEALLVHTPADLAGTECSAP